jgi:hypothetical protein
VKEFLRVDEYKNMDPVFARDAGLTIQPVKRTPSVATASATTANYSSSPSPIPARGAAGRGGAVIRSLPPVLAAPSDEVDSDDDSIEE